jgi:hypothetical protein
MARVSAKTIGLLAFASRRAILSASEAMAATLPRRIKAAARDLEMDRRPNKTTHEQLGRAV